MKIKSSGDMERARNSRVNPLTLTCDLGHVLCTPSYYGENMSEVS